jgi:hypothetical protein
VALHEKSRSLVWRVLAPEEQHVYSTIFLMYPAPSGAACKRNAPKHMALRWSAHSLAVKAINMVLLRSTSQRKMIKPKPLFVQSRS